MVLIVARSLWKNNKLPAYYGGKIGEICLFFLQNGGECFILMMRMMSGAPRAGREGEQR